MPLRAAVLAPYYRERPIQILVRLARELVPNNSTDRQLTLPWHLPIRLKTSDAIGASIWRTGVYELAVSEALWRLIEPGDFAVDAGANIGYMTSIMAARAGRNGVVVAFEPHPHVYESLLTNVRLFGDCPDIAEIRLKKLALGAEARDAILTVGEDWIGNRGVARIENTAATDSVSFSVSMVALDEAIGDADVALLKIDVEGHETEVLRGAGGLLSRGRIRNIIFEETGNAVGEAYDILRSADYEIRRLEWERHGLILSDVEAPRRRTDEPPNFIASRNMEAVAARLSIRGWEILHSRKRRRATKGSRTLN